MHLCKILNKIYIILNIYKIYNMYNSNHFTLLWRLRSPIVCCLQAEEPGNLGV